MADSQLDGGEEDLATVAVEPLLEYFGTEQNVLADDWCSGILEQYSDIGQQVRHL